MSTKTSFKGLKCFRLHRILHFFPAALLSHPQIFVKTHTRLRSSQLLSPSSQTGKRIQPKIHYAISLSSFIMVSRISTQAVFFRLITARCQTLFNMSLHLLTIGDEQRQEGQHLGHNCTPHISGKLTQKSLQLSSQISIYLCNVHFIRCLCHCFLFLAIQFNKQAIGKQLFHQRQGCIYFIQHQTRKQLLVFVLNFLQLSIGLFQSRRTSFLYPPPGVKISGIIPKVRDRQTPEMQDKFLL